MIGDAGVGKSRLVREFLLGEEARVVRSRCLPYGEGITFWPLAQMVRQAAGIDESEGSDESVAQLQALLEPDPDAHTIAETIAHLTGLTSDRYFHPKYLDIKRLRYCTPIFS